MQMNLTSQLLLYLVRFPTKKIVKKFNYMFANTNLTMRDFKTTKFANLLTTHALLNQVRRLRCGTKHQISVSTSHMHIIIFMFVKSVISATSIEKCVWILYSTPFTQTVKLQHHTKLKENLHSRVSFSKQITNTQETVLADFGFVVL
jgi:hypothetical protein